MPGVLCLGLFIVRFGSTQFSLLLEAIALPIEAEELGFWGGIADQLVTIALMRAFYISAHKDIYRC